MFLCIDFQFSAVADSPQVITHGEILDVALEVCRYYANSRVMCLRLIRFNCVIMKWAWEAIRGCT